MMDGKKTIIGLIVSAIGLLNMLFNWGVPMDDLQTVIDKAVEISGPLMSFVGLALAFFGRLKAKTPGALVEPEVRRAIEFASKSPSKVLVLAEGLDKAPKKKSITPGTRRRG